MKIQVSASERAFLVVDGRPERYLGPGLHRVLRPFAEVSVETVSVKHLLAELDAERLALVPAAEMLTLTLSPTQRALVTRRGRPVHWLGAGAHQVWTVDRDVDRATGTVSAHVSVQVFDVSGVAAPLLSTDVAALAKAARDLVEVTAAEGQAVLRHVDGAFDAVLAPGRHAAWSATRTVTLSAIDLRERLLNVTGQEVMTKDRVTLRLNVTAVFRVKDVRLLAQVARAPDEVLYLALQLAAREAVTSRTLDELLAAREALSTSMAAKVAERAASLGLELVDLGVKDVVLPGEMKELLNKVIAAQKQAEANVIFRREETAATRSLAQTARVLAEQPLLLRLKELEAYQELAGKVGTLHVVLGDSALEKLKLER
jgi:regulator of protease activity HflC (stomatin/prohibitin superfamily)